MNRVWMPSQLATPERVAALLAGDDLDEVTREHLQHHLAAQQSLATGQDPFRGLPMGAPDDGWWTA